MKRILLSIKPCYAKAIFEGRKTIEYRKICPKNMDCGVVIVYATTPVKRIIGEFIYDRIIKLPPAKMWSLTASNGCIAKDKFFDYFKGKEYAYGLHIVAVKKYKRSLTLSNFGVEKAPQMWQYLVDDD